MTYQNDYYNTVGETGATLKEYRKKAQGQNDMVLKAMKELGKASPSQLMKYFPPSTPITSVRRSLSNLTREGYLRMTEQTAKGLFGRLEHVWELSAQMTMPL